MSSLPVTMAETQPKLIPALYGSPTNQRTQQLGCPAPSRPHSLTRFFLLTVLKEVRTSMTKTCGWELNVLKQPNISEPFIPRCKQMYQSSLAGLEGRAEPFGASAHAWNPIACMRREAPGVQHHSGPSQRSQKYFKKYHFRRGRVLEPGAKNNLE